MSDWIVETSAGNVRGAEKDGVGVFKGIPYGESPAGRRRWAPPEPKRPWTGVLDVVEQPKGFPQWAPVTPGLHVDGDMFGGLAFTEDALTVDVYTPACDDGKRPVMLYTASGGFFVATPGDGTRLAQTRDVVLVSMRHRIGFLGYLYLAELGGDRFADSGTVGLLDELMALQWIRDNIASFGGDPGNVTVFGISGGGQRVNALMAMPDARGLFHKAICQSGPLARCHTPEEGDRVARLVLEEVGVSPSNLDALFEVPAQAFVDAMIPVAGKFLPNRGNPTYNLAGTVLPTVDGRQLIQHPLEALRGGNAKDVAFMFGTCRDELNNDAMLADLDERGMRDLLLSTVGNDDDLDVLLRSYRDANPGATPWDLACAISSDRGVRVPLIAVGEAQLANGVRSFSYMLTWESPAWGPPHGARHGLDMGLVFNDAEAMPWSNFPEGVRLADQMSTAWATFARTGDPNHEGIPSWPAYDLEQRPTMLFDTTCRVENDPYGAERAAWSDIGF